MATDLRVSERDPSALSARTKGAKEPEKCRYRNYLRVFDILDGVINPAQSDVATDTDNTWTDGANVDAHAYVGFTYDFYFQRFGRRGLDGNNRAIRSIVHPAPREDPLSLPPVVLDNFLLNAFWCGECGQPGQGYMVFGEGIPTRFSVNGQNFNYWSAGFDVVAHELSHAVTEFTSNLIYENDFLPWFSSNLKAGAPFTAGATALEYSLQMAVAVANQKVWCGPPVPEMAAGVAAESSPATGERLHPISRDG